jgi:hypothetical protein
MGAGDKFMIEPKPYQAAFPTNTQVRIADLDFLSEFSKSWQYHHKLQEDQFAYASRLATVVEVGFYHGGDPVYKLANVPGLWLEQCLRCADLNSDK